MNTSKIARKRIQYRGNQRRKWPIVLSLIGASAIMAGAGIGVGYAIWNKPDKIPYTVQATLGNSTNPNKILTNVGDQVTIDIKVSYVYTGKITWEGSEKNWGFVSFNNEDVNLIKESDIEWVGQADDDDHIDGTYKFIPDEKGEAHATVQLLKDVKDFDSTQLIQFLSEISINAWAAYDHAESQTYLTFVDQTPALPIVDPEVVTNTDLIINGSDTNASVISTIQSVFTALPNPATKLDLSGYSYTTLNNAIELLEDLQKIDTCESWAAMLFAENYYCWKTYAEDTFKEQHYYKLRIYSLHSVGVSLDDIPIFNGYFAQTFWNVPTDTQYFLDSVSGLKNDYYLFSGTNYSSTNSDLTCSVVGNNDGNNIKFNQTRMGQWLPSIQLTSIHDVIKAIYNNAVSTWPTGW